MWIQQDAVVVEGIRSSSGNFSGNALSSQGISFPFRCSNCYFYASGQASMSLNGTRRYGNFLSGGSIHSGGMGKVNRTVQFNQTTKDLHNQIQRDTGKTMWQQTGRVEKLDISGVSGADLGKITRAVENFNRAKKEKEEEEQRKKEEAEKRKNEKGKQQQAQKQQSSIDNASNSYDSGMRQAQNMRDEANSITPQYQFELDYKKDLEKRAQDLENRLVNPNEVTVYSDNIEQIKAQSQARFNQNYAKINAVVNLVQSGLQLLEQNRLRRERQEQMERERKRREQQLEQERKIAFHNQLIANRKFYKDLINKRKSFFTRSSIRSTIREDGTSFQPIFMYFAYVKKGYDDYSENINYPNMQFNINTNAKVCFSAVYGFFPYSNGQYPTVSDMKQKMLKLNFKYKNKDDYQIKFYQWENSVDGIVSSLEGSINLVSNYEFSGVEPPSTNTIVFLTKKKTAEQSHDYWTGNKVEQKKTKKVNYFEDDKPEKETKEVDYWDTPKEKKTNTESKKTDYWD